MSTDPPDLLERAVSYMRDAFSTQAAMLRTSYATRISDLTRTLETSHAENKRLRDQLGGLKGKYSRLWARFVQLEKHLDDLLSSPHNPQALHCDHCGYTLNLNAKPRPSTSTDPAPRRIAQLRKSFVRPVDHTPQLLASSRFSPREGGLLQSPLRATSSSLSDSDTAAAAQARRHRHQRTLGFGEESRLPQTRLPTLQSPSSRGRATSSSWERPKKKKKKRKAGSRRSETHPTCTSRGDRNVSKLIQQEEELQHHLEAFVRRLAPDLPSDIRLSLGSTAVSKPPEPLAPKPREEEETQVQDHVRTQPQRKALDGKGGRVDREREEGEEDDDEDARLIREAEAVLREEGLSPSVDVSLLYLQPGVAHEDEEEEEENKEQETEEERTLRADELYARIKSTLSRDEFDEFAGAFQRHYARKQTMEETLRQVKTIFGRNRIELFQHLDAIVSGEVY